MCCWCVYCLLKVTNGLFENCFTQVNTMGHMKIRITPFDRKVFSASKGFTLVEVITVLVIIGILALFAAPEFINWRPRMRLKGIADTLSENLQRAKIHAIKNNRNVIFTFTPAVACPGGSYNFTDTGGNVVASDVMHDLTTPDTAARTTNVCLQASTFVAGDGFTSRGVPINAAAKTVTISNTALNKVGDPTYVITQSVAGGVKLQKVPKS